MTHFHGELLLGGARLRPLEGEITELPVGHDELWSGEFRIETDKLEMVQIGRSYLLILDDGRDSRVELTEIQAEDDAEHSVVRFNSPMQPR